MKSTITTGKLGQLTRSPLNVRETKKSDPAIGQLSASILAQGLISPLAVHAIEGGKLGVLAGDRRWQAIKQLKADKAAFDFDHIPLLLLEGTDAELTEISLAENYVRQGMRPPEIYAAFRAIKERNPDIADEELGSHYGLDKRQSGRIMRLAFLHPDIFAAYAAGKLDDEQAFAYAATADQELQLQTFEALAKRQSYERRPHNIRGAMKVGDREELQLLGFVGLDTYEAAGGRFEPNLFADKANEGRVMDGEILRRLVNDRLAGVRERIVSEQAGKGEITFVDEYPRDQWGGENYNLRVRPQPAEPGEEQRARLDAISQRLSAIQEELDSHETEWWNDEGDEIEEHAPKIAELEGESARLTDEGEEIEASLPDILPEGDKLAYIAIGRDGTPDVRYYWAKKPKAAGDGTKAAKPELTDKAERSLRRIRANMFGRFLFESYPAAADTRATARDALIFSLAWARGRSLSDHYLDAGGEKLGLVAGFRGGYFATYGIEVEGFEPDLSDIPGLASDDAIEGFDAYHHQATPEQKDRLAAFVYYTKVNGELFRPGRRSIPEYIGTALATPTMARRVWEPTAAFFDLFKKDRILGWFGAIHDQFRKDRGKDKSADLKANAAAFFVADDEAARRFGINSARETVRSWLPEWLRWNEAVEVVQAPKEAAFAEPASDEDADEDVLAAETDDVEQVPEAAE